MAGADAYLYILHESKSTPDPHSVAMLFVYMGRILETYLREHPASKSVPAIVPAILYTGHQRWNLPGA